MRNYAVLAVAFMMILSGCKRDSDVLATYKDGKITRGEFTTWMDARNYPRESILKKKSQQKVKLKQMALDRLTVSEARKAGFDKNADYIFMEKLFNRNFYAGYLFSEIRSRGEFSGEASSVSIIKLMVKNYRIENDSRKELTKPELEIMAAKKMEQAEQIIKKLEDGESFSDLAKKYSEDYSKKNGGDIGYITRNMRGPGFSEAVFSLKKGEYTRKPFRMGNTIYIIRVNDRATITGKNINRKIKDEKQRERIKRRLQSVSLREYQKKLMDSDRVVKNYDNIKSSDKGAVLFSIGEFSYTVGDLDSIVAFISGQRKKRGMKSIDINDKVKRNLVDRIMKEEIFRQEVIARGLDKEKDFIDKLAVMRDFTLANAYRNDVVMADVSVTPREVLMEYNKRAERLKKGKKRPGKSNTMPPFVKAREKIEYMLLNKKRSKNRKDWEEGLIKAQKFEIIESELEGE